MYQSFVWYSQLGGLPRALLLFPLGLVMGSFSTMLHHRIPLRQSILRPGSHCTACGHGLGPADLVPVFSYLWLRGRCRFCEARIPVRYIVFETILGIFVACTGMLLGWLPALATLVLIPLGVVVYSRLAVRAPRTESGFALVEILVGVALLMTVAIPMYQTFISNGRGVTVHQRQYALAMATMAVEDWEARVVRYSVNNGDWISPPPVPPMNTVVLPGISPYDNCVQIGDVYLKLDKFEAPLSDQTDSMAGKVVRQATAVVTFWRGACGPPDGIQVPVKPVKVVVYLAHTP